MELNSNSQEFSSSAAQPSLPHIFRMEAWAKRLTLAFERAVEAGTFKDMRHFSRVTGIDYSSIAKYFDGGVAQPRGRRMTAMANALAVSEEWLRTGRGETSSTAGALSADVVEIPVYDLKVSAGPGAWSDDEPEPLHLKQVHRDWLRSLTRTSAERLAFVFAAGDSMYPTINDGDEMLIDMLQRQATREAIYALRSGDAVMVKRISPDPRQPGRITVSSDNPNAKSWEADQQDIRIVGRVVWLGKPL